MSRCQRRIVSGVTSSRSLVPRFRYDAEQGRGQCPVRPVQVRAARRPPVQDGELVAQDQDLGGPHASSRRDSRSHVITRATRRKANCSARRRTRGGTDVRTTASQGEVNGYLREPEIALTWDPAAATLHARAPETAKTITVGTR
jgi:hypothetical protein